MKRTKRIFICLILSLATLLSLTSCGGGSDACIPAVGSLSEESSQLPIDPPSDPDIISPLASKDLMDINNYSWVREYPVEFVMIHFCSDVVANPKNPYSLSAVRKTFEANTVSINYIIDRNGDIHCWIPEQRAAWHAGKGSWKDDDKYTNLMNKYSIGIEILAVGSKNDMKSFISSSTYNSIPKSLIGYTDEQYASLIAIVRDICQRWDIPMDRDHIIGHSEYAGSRRPDPGELFNWDKVINGINAD